MELMAKVKVQDKTSTILYGGATIYCKGGAPKLEPSPKKGAGLKKEKTLTSEGASIVGALPFEGTHAKSKSQC